MGGFWAFKSGVCSGGGISGLGVEGWLGLTILGLQLGECSLLGSLTVVHLRSTEGGLYCFGGSGAKANGSVLR